MDLNLLRQEIDAVDDEILSLLLRRMAITRQVAQYKIENKVAVLNSNREIEILNKIGEKSGEYDDSMKLIYSTILDASRADQHQLIGGGNQLRTALGRAKQFDFSSFLGKVACPGVPGAYSAEAALHLFPQGALDYYDGFEDVFLAVKNGDVDFGVIPVENSTSGSVHETYDHIMNYRFFIAKAFDLPIHHCLCAKNDVPFSAVKQVYSHPQGLAQCKSFLDIHQLQTIAYSNTATAAKFVSKSPRSDLAAICSLHAAQEYGLSVLDDNIQINHSNTTRFIVITRDLIINPDANKISMLFAIPHTTGSLYKVLGRFSMYGLNLTKIESRPSRSSDFKYQFYLDLAGNVSSRKTTELLCALSADLPAFEFLGNFKEEEKK